MTDSTFAGNKSFENCGWITCGIGGAILFAGSELTLLRCTFADNDATSLSGAIWAAIPRTGFQVTVANTTFARNHDPLNSAVQISIDEKAGDSATITNSTFLDTGLDVGPGVKVTNTIIVGSTAAPTCGSFTDGGHNLQWPGTSCGETIPSLDPMLDPNGLEDNGGPTQTIALLPGSPAIDAGDPQVCASLPVNGVDQRGYLRPGEGSTNCSIGAYEYDASDLLLCNGDCNGDGEITVDEVIAGVNIALGNISVCACMPCDTDDNGVISIAELIKAVHYALTGCPFWNGDGGDPQGSAAAWIEAMRRRCEE